MNFSVRSVTLVINGLKDVTYAFVKGEVFIFYFTCFVIVLHI